MEEDIEQLKYPIGRFREPKHGDAHQVANCIEVIRQFPEKLSAEVNALDPRELGKRYRPDGWTIKQVVHHCADSHMNSFIRFKLALTEDTPTIKPYEEGLWATLPDTVDSPIGSSLKLLEGLHERWVVLLQNLSGEALDRQFKHPEKAELVSLKTNIAIYAWHCEHHLAHVRNAKAR